MVGSCALWSVQFFGRITVPPGTSSTCIHCKVRSPQLRLWITTVWRQYEIRVVTFGLTLASGLPVIGTRMTV
jgi:hypothetical protein